MGRIATEPFAEQLDLTIERNADWELQLTLHNIDETLVDLTGYSAKMKIKYGETLVYELTNINGKITLGGTAGTIILFLSKTDLEAQPYYKTCNYDLLIEKDGNTKRILEGVAYFIKGTS